MEATVENNLELEIKPTIETAGALVIKNEDQNLEAQRFLGVLKDLRKKVTDTFDPICSATHKAWNEATSKRKLHLDPIDEADRAIRKKSALFIEEQERIREQIAREAEAKRQKAEREEREKIEAQAKKAAEKGNIEKAEALKEKAANVYVPPAFFPQAPVAKAAGVSTTRTWKAEVSDFLALIVFISENPDYANLLEVNTSALNSYARMNKGLKKIPGVRFYEETNLSVRK